MKKLMRNKGILLAAILVLAVGLLAAGCGGEETSGSGGNLTGLVRLLTSAGTLHPWEYRSGIPC